VDYRVSQLRNTGLGVVGLFEFVRLERYLTQLLGRQVDLATLDALHKALRASILSEAIRAA